MFIESRNKPICDVPEIVTGNQVTQPKSGGLVIEADEYDDFIAREPMAENYIKRLVGSKEFINNLPRYCLWLVGVSPSELRKMPLVMERIENCRQFRLSSSDVGTQKLADRPTLFRETINPDTFIVIPKVSSENRRYIPIGFLTANEIPTNTLKIIPDAALFHFGILSSNVHNAWMRTVGGRMKSDYQYSKQIVYNNFPWPDGTDEQKRDIGEFAQAVLDARAEFPESSFADLYDPRTMPPNLRKAHQNLDRVVMKLYGFSVKDTTEASCVASLMDLYQKIVHGD